MNEKNMAEISFPPATNKGSLLGENSLIPRLIWDPDVISESCCDWYDISEGTQSCEMD